MEFLYLFIGLILGFVIAWFIGKSKHRTNAHEIKLEQQVVDLEKSIIRLETEKSNYQRQTNDWKIEIQNLTFENKGLHSSLSAEKTKLENLFEKLENQKTEIDALQKKFIAEFENLANKVLEEKSKSFSEYNKTQLGIILNPFSENLKEFKTTVKDTYEKGLKERTELSSELKHIQELNQLLRVEASNLTKALKGDVQKQGRWGEMILEKILESSGLEKDQHYKLQDSHTVEDGKRYRPDAIVYLPDDKNVIIDSKVSLVAYEKFASSDNDEDRAKFIKEHLLSVRNHIKELSTKDYISNLGINTPEYLLMFIPIEASFSAAVTYDRSVFNEAWDKRIVIVSPATLIATLMTISAIWKQNKQTENALQIAERGGKLYDKFRSFVEDMERIGSSLDKARTEYDNAMTKLSVGSGNLVKQTEMLKALGAKTTKSLSKEILANAHAQEQDELSDSTD